MIPACGQGILAVQGRRGEDYSFLDCLRNQKSQFEAEAERAFVTYLDGGCSSPIGALAQVCDGEILIRGLYYNEQTCRCQKGKIRGKVQDGIKLAIELAKKLKEDGKG